MIYKDYFSEELKKQFNLTLKEIEEDESFVFDVVATTETEDRAGEKILIKAWDTKDWNNNPVVLANHDYTIQNIIGRGLDFYEKDGKMRLKGVFSKTNPLGLLAKELYNEGLLNAVSVGFLVKGRDKDNRNIITKAELLEVSFVAVPCNAEAIRNIIKNIGEIKNIESLIKEEKEVFDIEKEIKDIKNILQTLADDKAKEKEEKQKENEDFERLKAKKQFLQEVNKATALALEKLKKLY